MLRRLGSVPVLLCTVFTAGGASSAPAPQSVNAETQPGVSHSIEEWEWLWDDQTVVGEFEAPLIFWDRRHGRTHDRGETVLRYQLRIPEDHTRIRGIMVLVPGLDQHSGRYRYFVERFKNEFIMASCDTRFMGRSNPDLAQLEQGDPSPPDAHRGLRNIRKFFYIVYDLDQFVQEILPQRLALEGIVFRDQPLILVGHSLGGLAVLDYVLGNDYSLPPANLAGLILSSPALRPPFGPTYFQKIIINYNYSVNASFGSHTEERTLFMVAYEQMRDIIMTPIFYLTSLTRVPIDAAWASEFVTDDPWEQIGFHTDPMTIRRNPLNFVYQVQEHMIEVRDHTRELHHPYLLFYAQGDHIVDPSGSEEFVVESIRNHPLNQGVPIPDTYAHELIRARPSVRNRIFDIASEWVDELLPAGPAQ